MTVFPVVSRSRDKLGPGFQRSWEAERHGRLCHAGAAPVAWTQQRGSPAVAAPGQRPPRPPRSAPSHDTNRGGGEKEGK